MPPSAGRDHDVVVFGATGFTGELTATYLARHAPAGCRWALAGRNRGRLEAVRDRLTAIDPVLAELPLLTADVADPSSLRRLAQASRVLITTVGPYLRYGEPLVAACAAAGTDYVDLTGEPEFVDRMYLAHHETASRSGARLVHSCGFESVPVDLGVLATVKQLPAGVPLTVRGVVRAHAAFSGGTVASLLLQASRPRQLRRTRAQRRRVEATPTRRRTRAVIGSVHRDADLGHWVLPLPTIDPIVVSRSAAARDDYGPDFSYSHFAGFPRPSRAVATAAGVTALVVAAQVPPVRRLVTSRLAPGQGPGEARRAGSWFTLEFVGEGAGRTAVTRISGGDPGYDETAMMVAEAALSLAFDDNPPLTGQLTPATAVGEHLLTRLIKSGISLTTGWNGS